MLVDVIDNDTGETIERRDSARSTCRTVGRYTYCLGHKRRVVEWEVIHGRGEDMILIWVTPRRTTRRRRLV